MLAWRLAQDIIIYIDISLRLLNGLRYKTSCPNAFSAKGLGQGSPIFY